MRKLSQDVGLLVQHGIRDGAFRSDPGPSEAVQQLERRLSAAQLPVGPAPAAMTQAPCLVCITMSGQLSVNAVAVMSMVGIGRRRYLQRDKSRYRVLLERED